jgi:hypothetical protein
MRRQLRAMHPNFLDYFVTGDSSVVNGLAALGA